MTHGTVQALNAEISKTFQIAEGHRGRTAKRAYSKLSKLEAQLAQQPGLTDTERTLARRGAIHAAVMAGHRNRAAMLLEHFAPTFDGRTFKQMRGWISGAA